MIEPWEKEEIVSVDIDYKPRHSKAYFAEFTKNEFMLYMREVMKNKEVCDKIMVNRALNTTMHEVPKHKKRAAYIYKKVLDNFKQLGHMYVIPYHRMSGIGSVLEVEDVIEFEAVMYRHGKSHGFHVKVRCVQPNKWVSITTLGIVMESEILGVLKNP